VSWTGLRASLIWRDEVMEDLVLGQRDKLTVGTRRIRRFPWFRGLQLVVADALVAVTLVLAPSVDLLSFACCVAAVNLVLWPVLLRFWRTSGGALFVVPDLGLPPTFAMIRPGKRGHLLTLGERMRGTICLGGESQDVADLVQRDNAGGFCATPVSGRDWGVIDLDESGDYKLFFQFVQVDDPPQFFTRPVLIAGGIGYLISSAALTLLWYWKGIEIGDAAFRGAGIAALAMIGGGIGWSLIRQDGESQASLAFSVVLHAALLFMTYQLYEGDNPFVWPGPRSLTGNYLVTRLDKEEPPEVKPPPSVGAQQQEAPAAATKEPPKKTATKGAEGKAGGKGEKERARDPNAKDVPPEPPKVQFFEDKNKKVLDNIIDRNLATSLSKFTGIKGDTLTRGSLGFGPGVGTGVGPGEGTGTRTGSKGRGSGGGGNVEGDFVTGPGKIDTGTNRPGGTCKGAGCGTGPRPVQVSFAEPSGDFGGLTAEEIDRVVKARAGIFRACYQKELNHSPGIGGKLQIHFKIGADGTVQAGNTSTASGTTLHNDAVEQCVKSNVNRLKFPAKGGVANVNYPFVFTQGG
jgi:outer membrane biosynthesis protein TonB